MSPPFSSPRYLVDVATLEISPQWINSNGAAATTYLIYFTNPSLLYFVITGDPGTTRNVYGESGVNIPIVSMPNQEKGWSLLILHSLYRGSTLILSTFPSDRIVETKSDKYPLCLGHHFPHSILAPCHSFVYTLLLSPGT